MWNSNSEKTIKIKNVLPGAVVLCGNVLYKVLCTISDKIDYVMAQRVDGGPVVRLESSRCMLYSVATGKFDALAATGELVERQ